MFRLWAAVAMTLAATVGVFAQPYPSKPIRIIVPFSAGGPTDVLSRIVAQGLQAKLGQSVVVENRLGAGGTIGTRVVAKSDPDGYTLLVGNTATLVIGPAINHGLDYDPSTAFTPVTNIASSSNVLVIDPKLPPKSVSELIAFGKANPDRLSYSSPGVGTPAHLIAEMFKQRTGIGMVHIPYKGGGASVQDVMTGQVSLTFENPATALPMVQAGHVRALAVTGAARNARLPDVPTIAEAGMADFVTVSFFGLVARTGTPAAIIAQLNAAVLAVLNTDEARATFERLSVDPQMGTPEEFAAFLARESARWKTVVAAAGIRVE